MYSRCNSRPTDVGDTNGINFFVITLELIHLVFCKKSMGRGSWFFRFSKKLENAWVGGHGSS